MFKTFKEFVQSKKTGDISPQAAVAVTPPGEDPRKSIQKVNDFNRKRKMAPKNITDKDLARADNVVNGQ